MINNKVSIILPTYNEALNIFSMIEEICNNMTDANYEIIVVDDNSPDGTSQVVEQAIIKYPQVKLLKRTTNRGLVPSIAEGIDKAGGDICVWMDADLTMSPSLIVKFVEQIDAGADLVLGSRYINGGGMKGSNVNGDKTSFLKIMRNVHLSGDSVISLIISKMGNLFMRFILDPAIHDYTSGFFGGKKEFLLQLGLEGGTIDYCITLPYKAKKRGFSVVEIPMILTTRKHGESKTSNTFLSILIIIVQCYKKAFNLRFGQERKRLDKIK